MVRSLAFVCLVSASTAFAFPWSAKHGYGSCAVCHVDPSGGGQLAAFGRTESERLVRWRPGTPDLTDDAGARNARFLWFLELPDAVNLSGNLRFGALVQPGKTPAAIPLEKAVDLSGTFTAADTALLHVTFGFGRGDAVAPAIVVPRCDPDAEGKCGASLVARTFWAGARLEGGAVVLRGGRLAVPFGLRNIEHTSYVRALTRTDTNVQQQLGVAAAYVSGTFRAEVMGLAGGFLESTREGGYAAYGEYALGPRAYVGVSSLVAHGAASSTLVDPRPATRHAHGLFARWSPALPLVLLAEADVLARVAGAASFGYAAFAQADWEVTQGLHLMLTAESGFDPRGQHGPALGGRLSAAWYFFSHCELRVDNVLRRASAESPLDYALVAQLHLYL